MEFLVHIEVRYPVDGDRDELARLVAAEGKRAAELAADGHLRRLWRIPGERANWGIWEAADATDLHAALGSLPLFPYMSIEVTALAQHPNDPERPGGR
jgi:muconolactone D-isomerase